MAGSSESLLPFLYPDFYAKQLPIQRQQALSQALMQQGMGDPGSARYGGLRSAGNMLAGALLGRRADSALGQLYTEPDSPAAGTDTGQVSNAPQQAPELQGNQQPYEGTDTTNLFPGLHNTGQPAPQPQASPVTPANDNRFPPIAGLSQRDSMLLFLSDPAKYLETVAQQNGPTDFMKSAAALYGRDTPQYRAALQAFQQKQTTPDPIAQAQYAAGGDNPQARALAGAQFQTPEQRNAAAAYPGDPAGQTQAIRAQVEKAGTQDIRPGNLVLLSDGRWMSTPDRDGRYTIYDANKQPILQGIVPGAIPNTQALSQAGAAGAEPEKIINVTRADGSVVPMRAGTAVGGAQAAPAAGAPAINGASKIGQSTAQATLQQHVGTEAAADAKFQASADVALATLDHLEAINNKTPDSTYADPTVKADWARRFGASNVTTNVQLWHTYNENALAGAIEQIRNSGGSRIPQGLVEELKKARGIDIDDPIQTRAANIQAMRQVIMEAKAASHNTVANMNAPDATTTTTRQPVGGPQAPQAQYREGQTATGPGGKKAVYRNGQWVPM